MTEKTKQGTKGREENWKGRGQRDVLVMKRHGVLILQLNDDSLGEALGKDGIYDIGGYLSSVWLNLVLVGRLLRVGEGLSDNWDGIRTADLTSRRCKSSMH